MVELNEKNIQSSFCYNPNDGIYHPHIVKNSISLSRENSYIKIYDDKAVIDLGYSIDNTEENPPIIKIDDRILIVRMLEYETDILATEIKSNEAIIITLAPEFSTSVFINSENIADNKNMHYEIESLNTSLSSWMLDHISKNINHNIPTLENNVDINKNNINILSGRIDENDSNISSLTERTTNLENDVDVNKNNINILSGRIDENDSDISSLTERTTNNDSDIENINTDISNLDERVSTNHNDIEIIRSTKQNNLTAGPNITINGGTISAESTDASLSGIIMAFAGPTNKIPTNALFCDGREISRTTYAGLYSKLGHYWGAGNGHSTFHIPDGRSGVLMGAGWSGQWTHQENPYLGQKIQTHMRQLVGDFMNNDRNSVNYGNHGGWLRSGIVTQSHYWSNYAVISQFTSTTNHYFSPKIDSSLTQPSGNTFTPNAIGVNFIIFV